jgi:hypothetical protein
MFRSQQHREKAAAYGELIKHSSGQGENDELQKLRDRHSALPDNEQGECTENLIRVDELTESPKLAE